MCVCVCPSQILRIGPKAGTQTCAGRRPAYMLSKKIIGNDFYALFKTTMKKTSVFELVPLMNDKPIIVGFIDSLNDSGTAISK